MFAATWVTRFRNFFNLFGYFRFWPKKFLDFGLKIIQFLCCVTRVTALKIN